jgi:ERCC4-type nuclease
MIASILIDQREPLNIQCLKFNGAPTVITLLEYGDLHVLCDDGALLIIERKTPGDLLNSLRDERLMSQIAGCVSLSPWVYLIIDGKFKRSDSGNVIVDKHETGWSWGALQGALLTSQELGMQVIQTGADDFENTVLWLSRRGRDTLKVHPRRAAIFATPQEQVLAALPGIGPEKAEKILTAHNGNLLWALCSLLDPDWPKQDGIGPKTKDNLRRLFSLSDGEILWPFYNEQPKEKTA